MSETTIDDVLTLAREMWWLPDAGLIEVTLAAVAANRLPDSRPVWLALVGPPSSGKTEALDLLKRFPECIYVSTFTEAGLISGSPVVSAKATGGVLKQLGSRGNLILPDMATILAYPERLALLREVHDGRYVRQLGTTGGREFRWEGKAGVLAAVSQAIDTVDMATFGPRFVLYRLPRQSPSDRRTAGLYAQSNVGHQEELRNRLTEVVESLFADLSYPIPPYQLDQAEQEMLTNLADFGTRCRSAVVRAPYSREIELVPEPEGTPRLAEVLKLLLLGLRMIGVHDPEAWRVLGQICVGGIHSVRWRVLETMLPDSPNGRVADYRTSSVARRTGLPPTTTKRHLEDMTALGVIQLVSDPTDPEEPEAWSLSDLAAELWRRVGPVVIGEIAGPSADGTATRLIGTVFPGVEEVGR
jgi:hypothetical protein